MSKIILKKNGTDYLFGLIPLHYPGDRVYLDGDPTKTVQDKVARKSDLTNLDLTGTTATQAISSGTYFYLNGVLVRAKTDIASGATFTLNTNYEVKTVGDAIDELSESNVNISTVGTQIPNGVYTTVTAEKDGYLSVYSTNTDTIVVIAVSGDSSILATAKAISSSEWAYTNVYVRKGESLAVKANGTHGNYRFHYFSA